MLTFQQESVAQCWEEILPLAQAHWFGTQSYHRHEPFAPKKARYEAYEQMGCYRLLTARDGARLAGYFGLYVTDSMHSQLPMVTEDTFFLHPDYRKGRNAIRFIRYCEQRARDWGAHEILFSCEAENTVAKSLLTYLDYTPVILQYSKHLPSPSSELTAPPPSSKELSHVCTEPASRA